MMLSPTTRNVIGQQAKVAVLALSAMALVLGGLAFCIRQPALAAWIDRETETSARQTKRILYHRDWFQEPDELWIYDRLPQADYRRGGVYFLGSSYVLFSTKLWDQPVAIQSLVHNMGMPASNPKSESLLLQYLVDQKGILRGGGEKNLVILGAAYQPAFYPSQSLPPPWVNAWERHGFFTCDPRQGIRAVPVNPISRFVEFEETFQAACLTRLQNLLLQRITRWRHHGVEPSRVHKPAEYAAERRGEMGPDWLQHISAAAGVFQENLEYLQTRKVRIRVVFMPEGSWEDQLPFSREYRRQLTALCAEKNVPISDWSKILADDDLADSAHPNIFGMEKEQRALLEIALPFLRSTGALPPQP